ncbi:MAG: hypothetical protein R2750_13215 [Bacteroidales bacterium]
MIIKRCIYNHFIIWFTVTAKSWFSLTCHVRKINHHRPGMAIRGTDELACCNRLFKMQI